MEDIISNYTRRSIDFRNQLQQAVADNSAGLSLVDRIRSTDADILANSLKYITSGSLILSEPSRSIRNDPGNLDTDSSSEGASDEETKAWDDLDPEDIEISENDLRKALAGQGAVVIGNETVLVHVYLGQRATDIIMNIQNTQPLTNFPGLSLRLWGYQEYGIAKIKECWRGPYESCILADEMGLGKTIQAILAVMSDYDERPSSFCLVVTTKTCVRQWERQMQEHFEEGSRPSCKILDSNRVTARELIDGNYDFVICSYGFIQSQYSILQKYEQFFEDVETYGQQRAEETTSLRIQKRRHLSLFSDLYSIRNRPISHLILDEAQFAKNLKTRTHRAIKALVYRKFLAVTGTPVPNRWWDIYGLIQLMKGHPFLDYMDFIRIFGNVRQLRADPPPSKLTRLTKFLMQVTVSRPATLLKLPGLNKIPKVFVLSDSDMDSVLLYTKLFLDSLRRMRHDTTNTSFRTATSARKALIFATRAQQHAAHPALMEQKFSVGLLTQKRKIEAMRARCRAEYPDEADITSQLLALLDIVPKSAISADVKKPEATGSVMQEESVVQEEESCMEEEESVVQEEESCMEEESVIQQESVVQEVDKSQQESVVQEVDKSEEVSEEESEEESEEREDDSDYNPNKGLDSYDDEDSTGTQENDEEETLSGKRKRWIAKVGKMADTRLASPRIDAIHEICRDLRSKNSQDRIVIFSKYVKFLDMVAEMLKRREGVISERLDGGCTKDQRQSTTDTFASTPGSILLITPRTGGAGLNGLECASKLIQCEPWWTGAEEAQAYGRLFRPNQASIVDVYYLQALGSSIDLMIERIRDGKNEINEKIIGPLRRTDDEPPEVPRIFEWY